MAASPVVPRVAKDQTDTILARDRLQHELRASERRLRIAIEMSPLSVYDWEPSSGTLNWDARLKAMWGLPPDAYVDISVFMKGLHPDDRAHVEAALARSLDPAGDGVYEAEFRTIGINDGVERWVMARGQMFFEHGKPVDYVGGAMDVTDRKRTEERLEKMVTERTSQLAASNRQLEEYVYSIAHDLRAPLRSMQSFSKLLLEDYAADLDDTAKSYAQRVVRAAESLDTMVTDLLAYSRVLRAEMSLEPVRLGDAWNAAVGQQEHAIRERNASIDLPAETARLDVRAHRATLVQVLANLLSNGLKFVTSGTTPHIAVTAERRGDAVRVWVADNGIGVAPEYQDKIFRVFERLHGKAYSGTGIGLAIVRTGLTRMGGAAGVDSAPGAGSRFWIELPAAG